MTHDSPDGRLNGEEDSTFLPDLQRGVEQTAGRFGIVGADVEVPAIKPESPSVTIESTLEDNARMLSGLMAKQAGWIQGKTTDSVGRTVFDGINQGDVKVPDDVRQVLSDQARTLDSVEETIHTVEFRQVQATMNHLLGAAKSVDELKTVLRKYENEGKDVPVEVVREFVNDITRRINHTSESHRQESDITLARERSLRKTERNHLPVTYHGTTEYL